MDEFFLIFLFTQFMHVMQFLMIQVKIFSEVISNIYNSTNANKTNVTISATQKYIERYKQKYIIDEEKKERGGQGQGQGQGEGEEKEKNENIDPVFYEKSEFQKSIQQENNELETKWKTRVLFESSPRGNVIMYFNPYKMGFVYYSDQSISHDILNVIALKYVVIYRCLDFFMDEQLHKSPLVNLLQPDKKDKEGKDKEGKDKGKGKSPFAKLKSYTNANTKETVKEIMCNRFIHLGKIVNYTFLKLPPKKKTSNLFDDQPSLLDELLKENADVQTEVLTYKEFKKSMNYDLRFK